MKILVTGGFGYLGGRVAQSLDAQGHEVLLGSRTAMEPPSWLPRARIAQTDWNSLDRLREICDGVAAVIHLAGMNAQDCAMDPSAALEVNAVATARLVRAAIEASVRRFVYISTAHVYGEPLSGVITEDSCPFPRHPYATSHRAAEDVVRYFHNRKAIEGVVIRLSNAFGKPMRPEVNCWTLLVNDLCRQAVISRRMVLRSSGRQRRDFIPLSAVCRAVNHLVDLPVIELGDGVFNAGTGFAPTVLDMTRRVADRVVCLAGYSPEVVPGSEDGEVAESLEYRVTKPMSTGFQGDGAADVDQEIDGLIGFCFTHCR